MTDLVLLSRDGDTATVALNRGERMNAFNLAMWDALRHPHQSHRTLPADAGHAGPGGAGRALDRA